MSKEARKRAWRPEILGASLLPRSDLGLGVRGGCSGTEQGFQQEINAVLWVSPGHCGRAAQKVQSESAQSFRLSAL